MLSILALLGAIFEDVRSRGAMTREDRALRERLALPMRGEAMPPAIDYVWGPSDPGTYRRVRRQRLLVSGKDVQIAMKFLGEGAFSSAWVDASDPERVWVFTRFCDVSKGMLSELARMEENPFLPYVREVGMTDVGRVYVMPRYRMPFSREIATPAAYAQVQSLRRCYRKAMKHEVFTMDYLVGCAEQDAVLSQDEDLIRALKLLLEQARRSGKSMSMHFDFVPRNLGVDKDGHLILVDPMA